MTAPGDANKPNKQGEFSSEKPTPAQTSASQAGPGDSAQSASVETDATGSSSQQGGDAPIGSKTPIIVDPTRFSSSAHVGSSSPTPAGSESESPANVDSGNGGADATRAPTATAPDQGATRRLAQSAAPQSAPRAAMPPSRPPDSVVVGAPIGTAVQQKPDGPGAIWVALIGGILLGGLIVFFAQWGAAQGLHDKTNFAAERRVDNARRAAELCSERLAELEVRLGVLEATEHPGTQKTPAPKTSALSH